MALFITVLVITLILMVIITEIIALIKPEYDLWNMCFSISIILAIIFTKGCFEMIDKNELKYVKDINQDYIYSYTQEISPIESSSEYVFVRENPGDNTIYYLLSDGSSYSFISNDYSPIINVLENDLTIKYDNKNTPNVGVFKRQFHTRLAKTFKQDEFKYVFSIPKGSIASYAIHTESGFKTHYTSYIIKRKQ